MKLHVNINSMTFLQELGRVDGLDCHFRVYMFLFFFCSGLSGQRPAGDGNEGIL